MTVKQKTVNRAPLRLWALTASLALAALTQPGAVRAQPEPLLPVSRVQLQGNIKNLV